MGLFPLGRGRQAAIGLWGICCAKGGRLWGQEQARHGLNILEFPDRGSPRTRMNQVGSYLEAGDWRKLPTHVSVGLTVLWWAISVEAWTMSTKMKLWLLCDKGEDGDLGWAHLPWRTEGEDGQGRARRKTQSQSHLKRSRSLRWKVTLWRTMTFLLRRHRPALTPGLRGTRLWERRLHAPHNFSACVLSLPWSLWSECLPSFLPDLSSAKRGSRQCRARLVKRHCEP